MVEVGAAVIRDERGRVLIARRKADARGQWAELEGLWEFPGGKREPGESYETCVARELAEELTLPITPVRVLLELDFAAGNHPVHLAFVEATATAGSPLVLSVHTAAVWVEPSRLGEYRFCPADAAFLQQYGL